jgi:hypothetical protein
MPCAQEAYVVVLTVGVGQRLIIAVLVVRASVMEEVGVMEEMMGVMEEMMEVEMEMMVT